MRGKATVGQNLGHLGPTLKIKGGDDELGEMAIEREMGNETRNKKVGPPRRDQRSEIVITF